MSYRLDLKTGYPSTTIAPLDRLSAIASEVIASGRGFQYGGDLRGHEGARAQIARYLTEVMHMPAESSHLMLTTGALTAIDIVCRTLTEPGDLVVVEDPTFFFAVDLLRMSRAQVVGVPMLADGLDLDALDRLIAANPGRVKLVYTIPSFQNPTGYTMSDAKRAGLAKMALEHDFYILEDATYEPLYFSTPPPPPLKTYDAGQGRVIVVASMSKVLMPSLRLGWIWANPAQMNAFLRYKSDAASSRLTAEILTDFMSDGHFMDQVTRVREVYARKHDALVATLRANAPEWLSWHAPGGGFFIWATLPKTMTAQAVIERAHEREVDVFSGRASYVSPLDDRSLRLCFALLDESALCEAGQTLCEVITEIGSKSLGTQPGETRRQRRGPRCEG
ncbi:MAG: PLP-dependent aminotransferase family protein [Anaerolineae bacterium]|nr:PLP-dependent aminotransferase family protein [Anaerolineae bacterium]